MELKSKICTSVEQSKKLLELGLKPETADMVFRPFGDDTVMLNTWDWIFGKPSGEWKTPAWSLSRLIELMPEEIKDKEHGESFYLTIDKGDNSVSYRDENFHLKASISNTFIDRNLFDSLIEMIDWLIKNNYFNKEYLCNKI